MKTFTATFDIETAIRLGTLQEKPGGHFLTKPQAILIAPKKSPTQPTPAKSRSRTSSSLSP